MDRIKTSLLVSGGCILAALLAAGCGPGQVGSPAPGNGVREPSLVNGSPDLEHPGVLKLVSDTGAWCSATLIGKQTVLTAAHCFRGDDPQAGMWVRIGVHEHSASRPIPHPQYTWHDPDYDLAIVHLKSPVVGASPIPVRPVSPLVNEPIEILGFGSAGLGDDSMAPYFPSSATNTVGEVQPRVVVFGHAPMEGAQWGGICYGDSGGPALDLSGNLIGVHSYWDLGYLEGDHCLLYPGMATRVDTHRGWILSLLDRPVGGSSTEARCTAERCGSHDPLPGSSPSCYCDAACTDNNDCCPGYQAACSGGNTACVFGDKQGSCRLDCVGMGPVWVIEGVCAGGDVCCIQP